VTRILTPQFTRALDPILAIYNKRIAAYRESEKEPDKQKAEEMARILNNMQANNIAVQADIERRVAEWYKEQKVPPTAQEVKEHTQLLIPDGMSVTSMQAFHDDGFVGPLQGAAVDADEDTDKVGGESMLPAGTIVNPGPPPKKPTTKKEAQNPPLPPQPEPDLPTATGGPSTILLPEMAPGQ
jgi:hypothetical protein